MPELAAEDLAWFMSGAMMALVVILMVLAWWRWR